MLGGSRRLLHKVQTKNKDKDVIKDELKKQLRGNNTIRLRKREPKQRTVTPHVGVWIEISDYITFWFTNGVTPHVGVWIEIKIGVCLTCTLFLSHLTQVCGLKFMLFSFILGRIQSHLTQVCGLKSLDTITLCLGIVGHTSRRCVD